MGVPSFFRWLVQRYPLAVFEAIEDEPVVIDGETIPVDTTKPNPNGIEFDNLYLDMNNIIHPCFHPEDKTPPVTYDEVFQDMFEYIDRIFAIVRPRKLLYMAIDGVAPRAKMNQQRGRRFRAAKDAAVMSAEEEQLRKEFEAAGKLLPPKVESQVNDSNVITPGTEFMERVSIALRYYIHRRLNSDPGWRNIYVILSDANVPGEGEHKIMSFIRSQREVPHYDPNTRHCLYGLDADLIMLALATHEIHFSILRDAVSFDADKKRCLICGQIGHFADSCEGKPKRKLEMENDIMKKPYEFLNIWTLREYLEVDLRIPNPRVEIDFERLIDDFVFICFFVGNDFLPHMPTLEIREGAINLLMTVYKREFNEMGGYLSDAGNLRLQRVEHFIQAVGAFEEKIFKERAYQKQRQVPRKFAKKKSSTANREHKSIVTVVPFSKADLASGSQPSPYESDLARPSKAMRVSESDSSICAAVKSTDFAVSEASMDEEELRLKLKIALRDKKDRFNRVENEDKVMLGEAGWKDRYYAEKFQACTKEAVDEVRKDLILKYTEGLCWVMHYYYHGVCAWQWYYPYHYAPFPSDLQGLDSLEIKFSRGKPFSPFQQLLAVLPPASANALPEHYRPLMTDTNSSLNEFYPKDFDTDCDGKRFLWQGVVLLPFIDEAKLLAAVREVEGTLTEEEKCRNSTKNDTLFFIKSHPLASSVFSDKKKSKRPSKSIKVSLCAVDPKLRGGLHVGKLCFLDGDASPSVFASPISNMNDIVENDVLSAIFKYHIKYKKLKKNKSRVLVGVKMPEKIICDKDIKPLRLWLDEVGRYQVQNRPPVQGALSGTELSKAASSLVINFLQGKFNACSAQVPPFNRRPRPAGPTGYERGFPVPVSRNGISYFNEINDKTELRQIPGPIYDNRRQLLHRTQHKAIQKKKKSKKQRKSHTIQKLHASSDGVDPHVQDQLHGNGGNLNPAPGMPPRAFDGIAAHVQVEHHANGWNLNPLPVMHPRSQHKAIKKKKNSKKQKKSHTIQKLHASSDGVDPHVQDQRHGNGGNLNPPPGVLPRAFDDIAAHVQVEHRANGWNLNPPPVMHPRSFRGMADPGHAQHQANGWGLQAPYRDPVFMGSQS